MGPGPYSQGHICCRGPSMRRVFVQVRLLGGFAVVVGGRTVPSEAWNRRQAAALVKLLALAPQGRLHRERVIDALWPEATLEAGCPRLYKAAHYARRACGDQDAVVLVHEVVALFPGATVEADAVAFEAAAAAALSGSEVSPDECAAALECAGDLLPDDLGEPWLDEPRERLRLLRADLLRGAHRWEDLLRLEPADEESHVELLREAVLRGDRGEGLRRYARMEQALDSELGISPPPEAVVLRERLLTARSVGPFPTPHEAAVPAPRRSKETPLLERDAELDSMVTAVESAISGGHGVVILVSGEAGAGKSSLVRGFLDRMSTDVTVHMGGCDDLLAPRTLGPFHDMAEVHPELAPVLATERLDDVLPGLLRAFAACPTVVVVEDIHWADDATLDAIRFVARRVPGIAGALVLTFRDTHVDDLQPLRQLLGSLVGPQVRRFALSPLSVDAIRRLGATNATEAAEIHQVTQGNAFFVTEVLAAGRIDVPATVRDAILALSPSSTSARTLVERLSVVPSRRNAGSPDFRRRRPHRGPPAVEIGIIHGEALRWLFRQSLLVGPRVLTHRRENDSGQSAVVEAACPSRCGPLALIPSPRNDPDRSTSSSPTAQPQPRRRLASGHTGRPRVCCGSCSTTGLPTHTMPHTCSPDVRTRCIS